MIPLVLACDHGGFSLKESLKKKLKEAQISFEDGWEEIRKIVILLEDLGFIPFEFPIN